MSFPFEERVKETSTTTGTGTYSLAGAPSNFRTFVAGLGGGNAGFYAAIDNAGGGWEVGYGTATAGSPDTLTRTTILASSNGGSAVNWSAGTRTLFNMLPAAIANALLSGNAGTTRPSWLKAGGAWIDTTSATAWVFNVYDGTDSIPVGTFNTSTNVFTLNAAAMNVNGQTEDTSPDGAADFLLSYDTSASANKKIKLHRATAFKAVSFTRDVSLTGTQAITGVGFTPKAIIFFAVENTSTKFSVAAASGASEAYVLGAYSAGTFTYSNGVVFTITSLSVTQALASLTSFDTDGFTLTWTKNGSPTGTVDVRALCFR